jgi:ArsR family transcriptional regulator
MNAYRHMANLVRAMAHPVRLQIVEVLSREKEACVCHLENRLGVRQAYLSQHLARMRLGGVVKAHRDGLNVYYSLADESVMGLFQAAAYAAERLAIRRGRGARTRLAKGIPVGPCPCPKCATAQKALLDRSALMLKGS